MGFLRRLRRGGDDRASGPPAPAPIYLDLRERVLRTIPGDVGIAPSVEAPRVWGVLFEIGLGDGSATIVALADGTTSLYTSSGGGTIGGGAHEGVALASKRLVALADRHLDGFPPTDEVPLPGQGRTAIVVLAYSGVRRIEGTDASFVEGDGPASQVFIAAHDLVGELRKAEAGQGRTPS